MLSNLSNAEQGLAYPISILRLIKPVKLDIYAHIIKSAKVQTTPSMLNTPN